LKFVFWNKRKKDLIENGQATKIFMIGYIELEDNRLISKEISELKNEIRNDPYLKDIPSIKRSLIHFHAKDDCPEVREKVFKTISEFDFKTFIIVYRKDSDHFKNRFEGNQVMLYSYLVEKLLENRLHLYSDINIYFSKMGNIVREQTMMSAIKSAQSLFSGKWNHDYTNNINIDIQYPSQMAGLQIVDYMLWSVYRLFINREVRYYNYVKDKISLIHDIMDTDNYPENYYTRKNPIDIKKISPID